MTMEQRPEKPSEHDRRKLAPLEFTPECMVRECLNRGTRGAQCNWCGDVALLLCVPHAEVFVRLVTRLRCECGAKGSAAALYELTSLAGWV